MLQILVATTNKHKVVEFQSAVSLLLPDLKIITPAEFPNYPEVEENGVTFEENAQLKAVAASAFADRVWYAFDKLPGNRHFPYGLVCRYREKNDRYFRFGCQRRRSS